MEAELEGKQYTFILDEAYRWSSCAAPKDKDGKLDRNKAQNGDYLRAFVDRKLFPYLHGFKERASGPNTIEYKIGEIFGEIKNNSRRSPRTLLKLQGFRPKTIKLHSYGVRLKSLSISLLAHVLEELPLASG